MIKVIKYDDLNKNLMFPTGALASKQIIGEKYPGVLNFPHLLEVNGDTLYSISPISTARSTHGVPEEMTEAEALAFIEEKINAPQPEPEATAEERIAAAMEYQNMMI